MNTVATRIETIRAHLRRDLAGAAMSQRDLRVFVDVQIRRPSKGVLRRGARPQRDPLEQLVALAWRVCVRGRHHLLAPAQRAIADRAACAFVVWHWPHRTRGWGLAAHCRKYGRRFGPMYGVEAAADAYERLVRQLETRNDGTREPHTPDFTANAPALDPDRVCAYLYKPATWAARKAERMRTKRADREIDGFDLGSLASPADGHLEEVDQVERALVFAAYWLHSDAAPLLRGRVWAYVQQLFCGVPENGHRHARARVRDRHSLRAAAVLGLHPWLARVVFPGVPEWSVDGCLVGDPILTVCACVTDALEQAEAALRRAIHSVAPDDATADALEDVLLGTGVLETRLARFPGSDNNRRSAAAHELALRAGTDAAWILLGRATPTGSVPSTNPRSQAPDRHTMNHAAHDHDTWRAMMTAFAGGRIPTSREVNEIYEVLQTCPRCSAWFARTVAPPTPCEQLSDLVRAAFVRRAWVVAGLALAVAALAFLLRPASNPLDPPPPLVDMPARAFGARLDAAILYQAPGSTTLSPYDPETSPALDLLAGGTLSVEVRGVQLADPSRSIRLEAWLVTDDGAVLPLVGETYPRDGEPVRSAGVVLPSGGLTVVLALGNFGTGTPDGVTAARPLGVLDSAAVAASVVRVEAR